MTTKPAKRPAGPLVRTASGDYVVYRTLADPEMKETMDAYRKKVTRSKASAQAFLKEIGILNKSGKLARSYGG
jgi:predicted deacylase